MELLLGFCVYLIAGIALAVIVALLDDDITLKWPVNFHWLSFVLLVLWGPLAVLWCICVIGEFCTAMARKWRVEASKRAAAR